MKHHEHYYGWTIEWELGENACYDFSIRIEQYRPREAQLELDYFWVKESTDIDESLKQCRQLIEDIVFLQDHASLDKVLEFRDEHAHRN